MQTSALSTCTDTETSLMYRCMQESITVAAVNCTMVDGQLHDQQSKHMPASCMHELQYLIMDKTFCDDHRDCEKLLANSTGNDNPPKDVIGAHSLPSISLAGSTPQPSGGRVFTRITKEAKHNKSARSAAETAFDPLHNTVETSAVTLINVNTTETLSAKRRRRNHPCFLSRRWVSRGLFWSWVAH